MRKIQITENHEKADQRGDECGIKLLITAILVLGGADSLVAGVHQDEAQVLLKAATHQELVQGNLEAAIETYQKILDQYPGERNVAAEALFKLGMSYEKLGKNEAREAYERLLTDYADQADFVESARSRLGVLSSSKKASTTIRKLDVLSDGWGRFSPWNVTSDGKLAGATAYETGNIAVLELVSGEGRAVSDYGNWDQKNGFVDGVSISRDGKWLAAWHYKRSARFGNFRVISLDGKDERVLYRNPEGEQGAEWGIPRDWSPDGKWFAVQIEHRKERALTQGQAEIALISFADGTKRALKTYEYARRHRPKILFSPDGKYLAYDLPVSSGATDVDLFIVPMAGGPEMRIAAHAGRDHLVAWTPNGGLLFVSDRTGRRSLFRVDIENGRQVEEPVLVRGDFDSNWILGLSSSGSLFYAETEERHASYQVGLDPQTGRITGDPTSIKDTFVEGVRSPVWSADGRFLAFVRMGSLPRRSTIVIRDESGRERELLPSITLRRLPLLRWQNDGKALLAWGQNREKTGIFRINLSSGEGTLVVEGDRRGMGDWSSDGRYVFYKGAPDRRALIRRDMVTGEEETLFVASTNLRAFRLSPDGKTLIFVRNKDEPGGKTQLHAYSIEDARTRLVAEIGKGIGLPFQPAHITWSPDGKRVYIVIRNSEPSSTDAKFEIISVPIEGGDFTRTSLAGPNPISDLAVHPDGRRFAWSVSTRVDTPWVMENFLPPNNR